jgi:hypothetical protein
VDEEEETKRVEVSAVWADGSVVIRCNLLRLRVIGGLPTISGVWRFELDSI